MPSPTPPTIVPTGGRPTGDHDTRRQQVAQATWRVIHAHGIDKASLRSIAREAGCTTGVLTHYFKDKDELLAFAIETIFDWIRDETRALDNADDPISGLRRLYRAALPLDHARRVEWSVWLAFLSRARHKPAFADAILSWHTEFRARLQALMARGQALGCIRSDVSAAVLADQFNATLDGLSVMAPFERERFAEPYLLELMELAIDHLQPRAPEPDHPPTETPP
jgi:AcrR family transcriptional regulator